MFSQLLLRFLVKKQESLELHQVEGSSEAHVSWPSLSGYIEVKSWLIVAFPMRRNFHGLGGRFEVELLVLDLLTILSIKRIQIGIRLPREEKKPPRRESCNPHHHTSITSVLPVRCTENEKYINVNFFFHVVPCINGHNASKGKIKKNKIS